MELYLVAHNIRSLHNIGSLFRTADGVGVEKIYLTGYTAAPVDRFKRPRKEVAKVALGAEKDILWEKTKNLGRLIARLKKDGVFVIALEQTKDSISIFSDFHISRFKNVEIRKYKSVALIVGNEVRGVSRAILKKCDAVIHIPMRGKKESLNVGVAAGIALFKLREIFFI